MPTAKKEATIEELRQKLGASKNLFFTNYAGLTVGDITKLRNELRKDGASTYGVVKNTLFSRAAGSDLAAKFEAYLAGPTAIVFAGDDPVAPAKALKMTFGEANKPVEIKAAYIDGQIVDAKGVAQLASLPPKIELLGRLVGRSRARFTSGDRALGQPRRSRPRPQFDPRAKRSRRIRSLGDNRTTWQ